MTETQYYTLIAVPLVGILMNAGLYIYLASRIDALIKHVHEVDKRVAVLEDRAKGGA